MRNDIGELGLLGESSPCHVVGCHVTFVVVPVVGGGSRVRHRVRAHNAWRAPGGSHVLEPNSVDVDGAPCRCAPDPCVDWRLRVLFTSVYGVRPRRAESLLGGHSTLTDTSIVTRAGDRSALSAASTGSVMVRAVCGCCCCPRLLP